MTDTPPPSSPPPTASASPKRPGTILGRLAEAVREQNWFAVALEVGIVVLGVVIGFQVTAWGQERADRATEQEHLRQLAADLAETERVMARADSVSLSAERAGNRLWAAFYEPTPPPRDSLMWWRIWSDSYADARPLLGTAEAIIATGDLALVQDDSLRAAIVAYVEETRQEMEGQARLNDQWLEARAAMNRGIDTGAVHQMLVETSPEFIDWVRSVDPTFTFPTESRIRFPLRPEELFGDRTLAQAAWTMRNTKANLRMGRDRIREDAAALRQRVEAHIET